MNFFFLLKEGIVSLKRARLSAVISIVSISLSLTLIGIFVIAGQNVKDMFYRFYKQVELEAFIDPSLPEKEIAVVQGKIREYQEVEDVRFISSRQALAEFQNSFGEDLSSVLNENPLPPSFRIVINPAYSNPQSVEKLSVAIGKLPGIQEVIYQKQVIQFIHKYFSLAVLVAAFLAVVLLIVITILIFNTIRLTIHARMDIIQIMRLVGATNRFIKSPFIIEGAIQGIIGGLISTGIIWIFAKGIQNIVFPGLLIPPYFFLFIIGLGIVFGFMGSYLSVNKYLKY